MPNVKRDMRMWLCERAHTCCFVSCVFGTETRVKDRKQSQAKQIKYKWMFLQWTRKKESESESGRTCTIEGSMGKSARAQAAYVKQVEIFYELMKICARREAQSCYTWRWLDHRDMHHLNSVNGLQSLTSMGSSISHFRFIFLGFSALCFCHQFQPTADNE